MMYRIHSGVVLMLFSVLLSVTSAETEQVRRALVQFMEKLAPGNNPGEENWGWNDSSDPCLSAWKGISCDKSMQFVKKVVLDQMNFTGVLDAASVCLAKNLAVLSLNNNNVSGVLSDDISNCSRLTHLYLHGNKFTGVLPGSLSRLGNLKRIVVSDNGFSGGIPDISRISGLLSFLAQNNHFNGVIPKFEFSNLEEFNVSFNNLSGSIPDVEGRFNASSFLGNPGLCGGTLSNACPPPPPPSGEKKGSSSKMYLMYLGYALIGVVLVSFVAFKVIQRNKRKEKKKIANRGLQTDVMKDKISSSTSNGSKRGGNISEYSITDVESGMGSSSLVVLASPVVNGLKFEDLLRSPAELIGRGRNGSLYKVTLNSGVTLAVKRIRDWDISRDDFKKRVHRIDQVKHPNVMNIVAYYCSRQEQLLVYEFQQNGSLFKLLHESQSGQIFDWGSRLSVAARIAEALAFFHEELQVDGIGHGNLKSSNILFTNGMDPSISEYGLLPVDNHQESLFLGPSESSEENPSPGNNTFKADVYGFGVVLLELLTGKLVQNNGFDLGQWVNSAIREEWTVEVFDKALVSEGASEERMVNLLRVALKCINSLPEERPSMREVAAVINSIKENEEKSISSEA